MSSIWGGRGRRSRASNFAVQNCDLLLVIGARLDNVVTAYNPRGFARAAKIVVDIDAEELSTSNVGIDQPVVMMRRIS